jgi:hypothetical protein
LRATRSGDLLHRGRHLDVVRAGDTHGPDQQTAVVGGDLHLPHCREDRTLRHTLADPLVILEQQLHDVEDFHGVLERSLEDVGQ